MITDNLSVRVLRICNVLEVTLRRTFGPWAIDVRTGISCSGMI